MQEGKQVVIFILEEGREMKEMEREKKKKKLQSIRWPGNVRTSSRFALPDPEPGLDLFRSTL